MRASNDPTIRGKGRRRGAVFATLLLSAAASVALAESNDIAGRKRCFVAGIETYKEEPVYRDRASGSQRVRVPGAKGERCFWEPLDYRAAASAAPMPSASRAAAPASPRRRMAAPTASPSDQAQLSGAGISAETPPAPQPLAAPPRPDPQPRPAMQPQPEEETALPPQPPLRTATNPKPAPPPQPLAVQPEPAQSPPEPVQSPPEPAQQQPEPEQAPQPLGRSAVQPAQPTPRPQAAQPQPAPQPSTAAPPRRLPSAPPAAERAAQPPVNSSMRPAPPKNFEAKPEPSMALKTSGEKSVGKPGTDGLNIRTRPVRSRGTASRPSRPVDPGTSSAEPAADAPQPLALGPQAPQPASAPEPAPVSPLPRPDPRPVQPAPEELPPFAVSPGPTASAEPSGGWKANTNLGATAAADPVRTGAITTRPVPRSEMAEDSRPFQNWQPGETSSAPAASASPAPKPKADPPPAKPKPARSSNGRFVQLGSVSSYQKAKQFWTTVTGRYPDELEGLEPNIVEAQIEGRGTFFRVRVGPMSASDASTLCERLNGNCLVVRE